MAIKTRILNGCMRYHLAQIRQKSQCKPHREGIESTVPNNDAGNRSPEGYAKDMFV